MTLEQKLQEIVRKINTRTFTVEANVDDVQKHVNAFIDTQKWDVHLTIDRNIETSLQQIPPNLISSQDLLSDLLYAVSTHELGHNQNPEGFFGCPGDEEYFKKIVEGIRDALEDLKVADDIKDKFVPDIANLFEDYIVNCSYALNDKERESFKRGMSIFYVLNTQDKQGTSLPQLFGQFVDLQLRSFWREGEISEYASNITQNYSKQLTIDLFKTFTDCEELTDRLMRNDLSRDDELNYYEELNDKGKWNLKAYEFTKKIYQLLDNQHPSSSDNSDSVNDSSGSSRSGQSDQNQEQQEAHDQNRKRQKGDSSAKQDSGKPQNGKNTPQCSGEQAGKSESESQQGEQSSSSEQQGSKNNTKDQYKPSHNYYTQRYQDDPEYRQRINDESKGDKSKEAKESSTKQIIKVDPKGIEDPQEFSKRTSQFGGMRQAQPSSIRFGFGDGRNSGFSKQDLEQIFHQAQRIHYNLPDDLSPTFARYLEGEINLMMLYNFFEQLAERITIMPSNEGNDEVSHLPIGYLQRKRIERIGQVSLSEIDWESTMHMPNGDWSLFAKQCPITIDDKALPTHGSTRDICFIGDVSGSMGYIAPLIMYGVKLGVEHLQGHDHFLAMVHSVIKDIKEKEIGYHLKYSGILFSSQTFFSGWHSYYDLDTLFEWMYRGYENNGTIFEANVLQKMYDDASDKFLAIMLTDGDIQNVKETASVVDQIIKSGNDFVLIEYHPTSEIFDRKNESQELTHFGNYVRELGGEVHSISRIGDLFKITLGKARGMY